MWTIGEVKRKGNWAFKKNYWKTVLVAFILSLIVGGGAGSFSAVNFGNVNRSTINSGSVSNDNNFYTDDFDIEDEIANDIAEEFGSINAAEAGVAVAAILVVVVVFLIVFAILLVIGIALDILVINPVKVGTNNFFVKNLNTNAGVKEMLSAFDKGSYKNMIKVIFFKDLYTFLWTLLFIIPGIVKSYEYRMIPYIMAENPEMPMEQAFYESKKMMTGNKWNAFLLDLSFIGWYILSAFTLGILDIFYVTPYKMSTNAVLYETLKYGNGSVVYAEPAKTVIEETEN